MKTRPTDSQCVHNELSHSVTQNEGDPVCVSAGVPVTAAKRPRTNKPAVPMGALAGRVGLQPQGLQGIQGLQGLQGAQLAGISQPMQMHSQTLAAAATLAGYLTF